MLFLSFADLFKINVFKKFFRNYHLNVKQFGSRSGATSCRAWSGSKLFVKVICRRQKPPLAGKDLKFILLIISFIQVFSSLETTSGLVTCNDGHIIVSYSDFFTNLFLWVPGLTRPKFFASQTRSSASHMGPTLNHKFYVSIQIRPIHRSQFEKQDTVILTYTIKSKLTVSCKIIFRAQAISLCSSNSACLQVYCWTYGDDTILIFVNTICSQYSPRTSWACSNTLTILFAELILGFV